MRSKFSRSAAAAVAVASASGLVAASAQAAAKLPSAYLVNQPQVTGAMKLTPESATLSGLVDTGGSPGTTFNLAPGASQAWEPGNIELTNTTSSPVTEYVDGIPDNKSTNYYGASGGSLPNSGADNNSSVVFEVDPVSDYHANGGNPGPLTQYADEVDVPTAPGKSAVKQTIGAYPASRATDSLGATTLKPKTKYYYWIVQQAGVTDDAQTVNTFSPTAAPTTPPATNPTWTCYPNGYVSSTAPYNGYSAAGNIQGQPEIQGPCVYIFGGGNNWYQSPNGSFTTPSLGSVAFADKAKVVHASSAAVIGHNKSGEPTSGKLTLIWGGKSVATGSFKAGKNARHTVVFHLTSRGKALVGGSAATKTVVDAKTHKKVTKTTTKTRSIKAKLVYANKDDQTLGTKAVTLVGYAPKTAPKKPTSTKKKPTTTTKTTTTPKTTTTKK